MALTSRDAAGGSYNQDVLEGFGQEWCRFDQQTMSDSEAIDLFDRYFAIFPWSRLPPNAIGFDAGCGSGRWARFVAPRVGTLHCIDASEGALRVAAQNLSSCKNCAFHLTTVDNMPMEEGAMDFGYSLGVLHHIPDTRSALRACVGKLKPGAPFLLYLYYAFDNRPAWFRRVWRISEAFRRLVSRCPFRVKCIVCDACAVSLYWPLARIASVLEKLGITIDNFPLSSYRHRSFYVMRTDALDRFGTRLEKRFTRQEIRQMMEDAGLSEIRFREEMPFWVAVAVRAY